MVSVLMEIFINKIDLGFSKKKYNFTHWFILCYITFANSRKM